MSDLIHSLHLGRVPYRPALRLMKRLAEARRQDEIEDTLILVEHPPVLTLGRGGGAEDVMAPPEFLRAQGVEVVQTERGGRVTYHGPGQMVAYPILRLPDGDLHHYLWQIEQVVLETLAEWGLAAARVERHPGVWIGRDKIAAVGVAVEQGVTTHGVAINVDPDLRHFQWIIPCGLATRGVTSMRAATGAPVDLAAVERSFVLAFSRVFSRPVGARRTPGPWLMAPAAQEAAEPVDRLVTDLNLHTVCQSAACPNIGECWGQGTATFMLLGDICTRHCRFCNVDPGRPLPVDAGEPERVAEAAARLGLQHVVLTSVARDDLPDGGAGHFAASIRAVRRRLPTATVEVLVPDFNGSLAALRLVAEARPDVFNHNLETVERLSNRVRVRARYRRSLAVLDWARRQGLTTKSGLMLGLGETAGEVLDTLRDLRRAGCQLVTIGQYLQPTPQQLEVVDHVHPLLFSWYREAGLALGFRVVTAEPLARSSYHARQDYAQALLRRSGLTARYSLPVMSPARQPGPEPKQPAPGAG